MNETQEDKDFIKLHYLLDSEGRWIKCHTSSSEFDNILLIQENTGGSGCDLLFAKMEASEQGRLFLGHWNKGFH